MDCSVSQIIGKANEDTFTVFMGSNQPELKGNFRENFSVIGLFDGHGGVINNNYIKHIIIIII